MKYTNLMCFIRRAQIKAYPHATQTPFETENMTITLESSLVPLPRQSFPSFLIINHSNFFSRSVLPMLALHICCLENPTDGGAWQAAVHEVAKSRTRLSDFTFTHWRRKWQPAPVFLPGESQGQGSLVGCRLWGHTESDTTEATQQQQYLDNTVICYIFYSLML